VTKDISGERFGKLTAISFAGRNKHGKALWLCKCDCGQEKSILLNSLTGGKTKSCGCLNVGNITHGLCQSKLYTTYHNMIRRCYKPKSTNFKYYGGRGISICNEWRDNFQAFRDWAVANGYSDDLTIDRINVNGNYEPSNCRWVNATIQSNNRRNVKKVVMPNAVPIPK